MEWLRVARNPWGQEAITGVSWDLLWWFVGAAAAFIAVHAVFTALFSASHRRHAGTGEQGAPL